MKSLRGAINAKCRDCIYDQKASGTWRMQVEACTVTGCPLYPVRPVSTSQKQAEMAEIPEGNKDPGGIDWNDVPF